MELQQIIKHWFNPFGIWGKGCKTFKQFSYARPSPNFNLYKKTFRCYISYISHLYTRLCSHVALVDSATAGHCVQLAGWFEGRCTVRLWKEMVRKPLQNNWAYFLSWQRHLHMHVNILCSLTQQKNKFTCSYGCVLCLKNIDCLTGQTTCIYILYCEQVVVAHSLYYVPPIVCVGGISSQVHQEPIE